MSISLIKYFKKETKRTEKNQFLRRVRREERAIGVVTLGVSLSAKTASNKNKNEKKNVKDCLELDQTGDGQNASLPEQIKVKVCLQLFMVEHPLSHISQGRMATTLQNASNF